MPAETIERVGTRAETLAKKLAEGGETMDGAARRKLRKQLKRSQRKHHRMGVEAARAAKKSAKSDEKSAE